MLEIKTQYLEQMFDNLKNQFSLIKKKTLLNKVIRTPEKNSIRPDYYYITIVNVFQLSNKFFLGREFKGKNEKFKRKFFSIRNKCPSENVRVTDFCYVKYLLKYSGPFN